MNSHPSPPPDPRLQPRIADPKWQIVAGWALLVLGVLLLFADARLGGALMTLGASFLAWGTVQRWCHIIEAKQIQLLHWQIETMKRQAATCRAVVDAPRGP